MPVLLAWTADGLAARKLAAAAREAGVDLQVEPAIDTAAAAGAVAVVVDLEMEGAVDAVAAVKQALPRTLVAGFVAYPTNELWRAAEDAGCDFVTTRGALARQLPARIEEWRRDPGGRRLRLLDTRDIAGRIGVVARLPDSPVGPLAVYHLGGDLVAVQDGCPHAGALLSEGELDVGTGVVTCPRHGSRFDTRTGERLRGPADLPLATYRVVVEDTQVFLRLE